MARGQQVFFVPELLSGDPADRSLVVYLLALCAVKSLGRNPVGSETLLTTPHLETILHHTALPFPPSASPFSHPASAPSSGPALEALRIVANTLVLHAAGRNRFASAGGARAIAKALREEVDSVDRLFLLGRIGFLVTLERKDAVGMMVDEIYLVDNLVHHLSTIPPLPANFAALSEMLKLTNNALRFYPFKSAKTSGNKDPEEEEPWDDVFDPLLLPLLTLLHQLPYTDLSPPLTTAIHCLLSIPFTPSLLPKWSLVPSTATSPAPSSPVKNLLSRISSSVTSTQTPKKASVELPRRATRTTDVTGTPSRLLAILEEFFQTHLPFPRHPDDEDPDSASGAAIDEALPPLLLLLTRACHGSEDVRDFLKDRLLPPNLNRSAEAGSLESRRGLLGDLIRLMNASSHSACRDTAGELLWAICSSDCEPPTRQLAKVLTTSEASTLSLEIGYGNAAGLLFRKGLSGPPPARIEEIDDNKPLPPIPLNPITAIQEDTGSTFAEMTPEEKEREAERLLVLFDRMEKNKVISMGPEGGVEKVMRDKVGSGEMEEWERKEAEERKKQEQEEERRDEVAAFRQVEELRRRQGKKV
ncbi:hypothetical protein P7C73_g1537, partial [Tremellales sp. Uapishka_1]